MQAAQKYRRAVCGRSSGLKTPALNVKFKATSESTCVSQVIGRKIGLKLRTQYMCISIKQKLHTQESKLPSRQRRQVAP